MGCLCDQQAGQEHALAPVCIGHLWVFENLQPEELAALTEAALRRLFKKGQEVFSQGQPAQNMFSHQSRLGQAQQAH